MQKTPLARYARLSIAAAIATIALKALAYMLTGSVGLLSDAIESVVNLMGATVALVMLTIAARPADDEHVYGHSKAEYFSSGIEGALILVAAVGIDVTACARLLHPQPLEQAGLGLVVSAIASLVNFLVARVLLRVGRQHDSITLEADGRHLMTDVWTSVGVIGAVGAVALTGWNVLDGVIALVVAGYILWTGFRLVRRSVAGLMDAALPPAEQETLAGVLARHEAEGIKFHALRTRQAAARRFVSVHVLVPGAWTVQRGHDLLVRLEREIAQALPGASVLTHLEPAEDAESLGDTD
jgi:cation diffusion facilitator family transporter